ncbi:unnamed protein product, partial [Porites lobata]
MKGNCIPEKKTVVVKRFFGEGDSNLKIVAKEAKMLQNLRHPKVAEFVAVCPKTVVFTKDHVKVKRCESCKVEFAREGVVCIPHDIAVLHMERYLYPKKDGNGKLLRMEPTWSKETERFYCANKKCIIKRHPYFWK